MSYEACPKCGNENSQNRLECSTCGIVFEKYVEAQTRKADLKCSVSVSQSQIDAEDDVEVNINGKLRSIKLQSSLEDGAQLRLTGEGKNGGDVIISVNVIKENVRVRALWGMLFSILFFLPLFALLYWFSSDGTELYDSFGTALGLPLVPFFVFLSEFLTGVKFTQLSTKWDDLAGWQRGVLGTIIVVVALFLILIVCGFIASLL